MENKDKSASGGKSKMLAQSPPRAEVETPKAANPSQKATSPPPVHQPPSRQHLHFQWAIPPSGFSPDERVFPPLSHKIQRRREVVKLPTPPPKVYPSPTPSAAVQFTSEPSVSVTSAHTKKSKKKKRGFRGHSSNSTQHQ